MLFRKRVNKQNAITALLQRRLSNRASSSCRPKFTDKLQPVRCCLAICGESPDACWQSGWKPFYKPDCTHCWILTHCMVLLSTTKLNDTSCKMSLTCVRT